jgi:type IV secretion system protein VirD4
METTPLFWPPIYQNARAAILVMFLGFALLTLTGDTQGRIRSASGLAVGAALLAASALALTDPTIAAGVLLDSFKAWRIAGYSGIESIRGMVSTWDRFTEAQKLGVQTSLTIGLPVPLFFILRAISIAAPASSSRISKQGPWRARWMNRSELRQLRHNDTGLPLGLSGGAMLRYRPNPKTGWRAGHHVAIAGTRAGKGVSVVIPAIIDHDGPIAVLDIKGENFAVTRRYRRSLGRQVVVLNPFGVIEPSKDSFNPARLYPASTPRPRHRGHCRGACATGGRKRRTFRRNGEIHDRRCDRSRHDQARRSRSQPDHRHGPAVFRRL